MELLFLIVAVVAACKLHRVAVALEDGAEAHKEFAEAFRELVEALDDE